MNWNILLLVIVIRSADIDAQFINNPNSTESGCSGEVMYFRWTYSNPASVILVEWRVNGSRIASEDVGSTGPFSPESGYIGRLSKISNAEISLGSLSTSDVGSYTCVVTYNTAVAYQSGGVSLSVYDLFTEKIKIKKTSGDGNVELKASFSEISIIYTWKLSDKVIGTGLSIIVAKNGNYTLCISGGKADCLDPLISPCTSTEVTELSNCGTDGELFICGFSLFLIELVVFIVIMILLKLEKIGGFTTLKIIVSCVFLLIALIIGIILGVVLKECSKKNLSLGLGIGLGCLLAAVHLVIIYVIHKIHDSKKDDDKEKERQGTPVSTSNVKVTSEKAPSHGNPASKNGNVIVSLPNEPIRPLPVPPATRKNQLEPLSVENDGATSPEKKKKKKKKKKRKNTESTDAPEES